jgi:site-specific DNA recombinase
MSDYMAPPTSLAAGSSVWAYLRDSGGPTQERSVSQQKAEIESYCLKYGLILKYVFADVAASGGSTVGRNQFHEMVDLSEHEAIRPAGILIWNYARFARDLDDSQFYKATLRKRGIIIHSMTDPIPEGIYGKVIEVLLDIANEEKKRQASRDSRRGLHELVEKYGCVPGVPPRGFKREPVEIGLRRDHTMRIAHRWLPDPDWIPQIQLAFQMRAAGNSLKDIHHAIRIFGSLNSYTTFWCNPIYQGNLKFGDQVIVNYCQPMIDQDTWERVQRVGRIYARRRHTKGEHHPRRIHSGYLLSGIAKCSRCGSLLSGHSSTQRNGSRLDAYRCTEERHNSSCDLPFIPAPFLEQHVMGSIRELLSPETYLKTYRSCRQSQCVDLDNLSRTRAAIQHAIKDNRRKRDNLVSAIAESGHSHTLLDRLAALKVNEDELRAQLKKVLKTQVGKIHEYSDHEISSYALQMTENLQQSDVEFTRKLLRSIVQTIKVDRQGKNLCVCIAILLGPLNEQDCPLVYESIFSVPIPWGASKRL